MTGKKRTLSICILAFAIFLFPHLEQALSEFFRVLRPGGMLAITVARDLDALSHWYGEHITEPKDIRPALERARASGKPACVNVMIDPDVFSSGTMNQTMYK